MKQTLQDQYLLIKEGKGHKGVFLADAKRQFPNIVRNAATFEEASSCLKTKNIISENVIGLTAVNSPFEPKKKESYELAFENFLAEAKKKKEEDEKAELKATSKQVEKDLEHNFDYKDNKNPDNLIFDQIMTGYYTEMKDPKNADKTMQELKDMVFKNLQKDPIFYTKEGQFGVKGLGYSVDHPGLGEPKEPKGKYKASGYGDLNEGMDNMDPLEREARIALSRIGYSYSVLSTNTRQNLIDTLKKESKNRSGDKEFDNLVYRLESTENKSLEESKLRKVIRETIDAELEEMRHLGKLNPIKSDKERNERDPKPFNTFYVSDKLEKELKKNQHLKIVKNPENTKIAIAKIFYGKQMEGNIKKFFKEIEVTDNPSEFSNAISNDDAYGGDIKLPAKNNEMTSYVLLNNATINQNGGISIKYPNPKYQKPSEKSKQQEELLRESVEKELAAINKEAEHEIIASKLEKVQTLIDKKQTQISRLDEDEDLKDLTDAKKVKEISKDIKSLEKAKAKLEKMMHKGKAKSPRKEVIDEDGPIDETELNEAPPSDDLNKGLGYTKDMLTNLEKMAKINLEEDEPEFDI